MHKDIVCWYFILQYWFPETMSLRLHKYPMNLVLLISLSVHLFVCPFATQDLRNSSSVFCMKLESCKVRKVAKPHFKSKIPKGLVGPKMAQNWGFGGFDKNVIKSYLLFFSWICFLITCKNHMPGKNLVLELWLKNL